jgi:hypothetical protein
VNKFIYRNKDWLYKKYVTEKKSFDVIAKETGINRSTIVKWAYKLGIPTRNLSQSHKGLKPHNYRGWHWNGKYFETYVNKKKVLVHRKIMEDFIGRKLKKEEIVHHINENPIDNRTENLKIVTLSEHNHIHKSK